MTERWSRKRVEEALAHLGRREAAALALAWAEAQQARGGRPAELTAMPAAVQDLFEREDFPPIGQLRELYRRWPELAGPRWADCAEPLVVRGGELWVQALDRRIVRRLRHDARRLAARLNRHFGEGFVGKVQVIGPY